MRKINHFPDLRLNALCTTFLNVLSTTTKKFICYVLYCVDTTTENNFYEFLTLTINSDVIALLILTLMFDKVIKDRVVQGVVQ